MNPPSGNLVSIENSIGSPSLRTLYRFVKGPFERAFAIDQLNRTGRELLEERASRPEGSNFFDATLEKLGVTYEVAPEELARIPKTGPVLCVANHPFGCVDGIVLGSMLASVRPDARLLVNFLLGAIEELRDWTIEVNPFGTARAKSANQRPLRESLRWLREGRCLGTFPGGVVSHFQASQRQVTDPQWRASAGALARRSGATVVPVYFAGRNPTYFQALGMIHPRLRTALLIRQAFNKRGLNLRVRVGQPILPSRAARFASSEAFTQFMRARVYIQGVQTSEQAGAAAPSDATLPAAASERARPIAPRQPVERLLEDLRSLPDEALLVRKGPYSVYGAKAEWMPRLLEEIGRTREETFRPVGEGTGKPLDLDRFDRIYDHLFMWNDEQRELVGAYRYCFVDEVLRTQGEGGLYCNTLYQFKPELLAQLNPAIEVGRSYVTPNYQKTSAALALIWRGLGELVARNPQYKTLFGAVSMTDSYRPVSKSLMVEYLKRHKLHPTLRRLISARVKPRLTKLRSLAHVAFTAALPELDDVSSLVSEVEDDRKGAPVLLKHYLKLNGVILCFGIDQAFSDALDGFIVVDLLKTEPRYLRKYLGDEGYERFAAHHGVGRAKEAAEVV